MSSSIGMMTQSMEKYKMLQTTNQKLKWDKSRKQAETCTELIEPIQPLNGEGVARTIWVQRPRATSTEQEKEKVAEEKVEEEKVEEEEEEGLTTKLPFANVLPERKEHDMAKSQSSELHGTISSALLRPPPRLQDQPNPASWHFCSSSSHGQGVVSHGLTSALHCKGHPQMDIC